jgi:Uma2 family endonuclease
VERGLTTSTPSRRRRDDHVVVLRDVPWAQYDALCRARADSAGPRMAYLEGTLEIMSPSSRHEFYKKLIARLLEVYALERDVPLNGFGSTTYRKKAKQAGIEPDECYCVGAVGAVPDLAIEVVHTHGEIGKLEIYRRLGVREVWYWVDERFQIRVLGARGYREVERSAVLPDLDLVEIASIVRDAGESRQTEIVKRYQMKLRRRA